MVEFIIGVAVGAGGAIAIDKSMEKATNSSKHVEIDSLYQENEKFRSRCKELERKVEDLMSVNEKLMRQMKSAESANEDYEDELDNMKTEIKKLRNENMELADQLKEYKAACESYERKLTAQ